MILLCGIPSETPLQMVVSQLEALAEEYVVFNQRTFLECDIWFEVGCEGVQGELRLGRHRYNLAEFTAVYSRLMDDRALPELVGEPIASERRRRCRAFHDTLTQWMEIAPGLMVNRCAAMATNCSKPYQSQLIRDSGFQVPETLITTEPELVRAFQKKHKRIIYKSISSVRSIVQEMGDDDDERLERIRGCPTQFQAFVDGQNLRVHTVGEVAIATAVTSEATDYRYAARQSGKPAILREVRLSEELEHRCIGLSRSLGLEFAGIDLKVTSSDELYCFEVNPCPAFSYYESQTGQPISGALARHLASR